MIKCNSPYAHDCYKKCIVDMDAQQSQGTIICCSMAEDMDFNRERILQNCEYAESEEYPPLPGNAGRKRGVMNTNPIEEIIERMKNNLENNGCYAILRAHFLDYKKLDIYNVTDHYKISEALASINGFLYGLESTGFITETEAKSARQYLVDLKYNK